MVFPSDSGVTWGEPTVVHQHATETAFAVDPQDPTHIFAATRLQRGALPGEDGESIKRDISAVPYPAESEWVYKNGLLLESRNAGQTFEEVAGGLLGFGAYRWALNWTADDTLVLVGNSGEELTARPELAGEVSPDNVKVARVSLTGGRDWVGTDNPH
eukprot:SAG22_NODE_5958_length_925_cov_1.811138_1_plen_157_part_10